MQQESKEIDRTQCPICLDAGYNNMAIYDDGHTYCYSCGSINSEKTATCELITPLNLIQGECQALDKPGQRGISLEICQFMDYQIGRYSGNIGSGNDKRFCNNELVHIANYYDGLNKVAQKIRTRHKEFTFLGDKTEKSKINLYGKWKWTPNKNVFCIVVEGEIDQLTVLQVQGVQYPVVSVAKGSQSAKKALEAELPWLLGWKHIILAFDNDEAGNKATQEVSQSLEPGTFKVIEWPCKDANETLLKKGKEAITKAIWAAKEIRPSRSVTVKDVLNKVLTPPQFGSGVPWESLAKVMYGGFRGGEIIVIVGASGSGKTCLVKDIVCKKLETDNVAIASFEHSPSDTIQRYVGAKLNLKLHKPGTEWNAEQIEKTALSFDEKVFLYDGEGKVDVDDLFYHMQYWAKAKNCKLFIIDNLKALNVTLKKETLVNFMNKLKSFVKGNKVDVIIVSHVTKDAVQKSANVSFNSVATESHKKLTEDEVTDIMNKFALTWATGKMPTSDSIEGGNDIEALSDYVFYLARNKESQDLKVARMLKVKVGKCGRIDSEYSGLVFKLYYTDTGEYVEPKDDDIFPSTNSGDLF